MSRASLIPPGPEAQAQAPITAPLAIWLIGPAFGLVALWLFVAPPKADVPRPAPASFDRALIAPGPRRTPLHDPPRVLIGGFLMRCMECHRFFSSPPNGEGRTLNQHTHIALNHGLNNRCFNCHNQNDREKLVLYDGRTIGYDEVARLCAQCHGTVYRDWQHGTHGKTLGSWDASSGKQVRLRCTECHDPHSPAYQPIAPLPAPNTLRMGEQKREEQDLPRHHMPLRHWSLGEPDEGPPAPPEEVRPVPKPQESRP
jgi:hypothetical protein